ncbi:unnamed protein product [Mytilus edulis]|uniref:Double jelly roll-like domain-containing protein n=1 Tax=Mytilus edulis TaxID=6550 RepID=A0A8S3TLF8_MYTED|nr:unnamed protein product [Mytilus edulis]
MCGRKKHTHKKSTDRINTMDCKNTNMSDQRENTAQEVEILENWPLSSPSETSAAMMRKFSNGERPVKYKDAAVFDHCRLRNIYVTLNAERYPAVDYNAAFNENRIARVFKEAFDFRKKFYMDSLLSNGGINPSDFIDLYPLFVIDVSHQSECLKESTVDIQIRAEFARNVPANTEASALIISDRILQFQSRR